MPFPSSAPFRDSYHPQQCLLLLGFYFYHAWILKSQLVPQDWAVISGCASRNRFSRLRAACGQVDQWALLRPSPTSTGNVPLLLGVIGVIFKLLKTTAACVSLTPLPSHRQPLHRGSWGSPLLPTPTSLSCHRVFGEAPECPLQSCPVLSPTSNLRTLVMTVK